MPTHSSPPGRGRYIVINRLAEYLPGQEVERHDVNRGQKFSLATAKEWIEPAEELIGKYPAACLASAFVIGVAIAWWIKRT